ncbi:MAG: exodeoxyribonuclease VII large subunit [Betaproteobacteria bacterium]|nr:exodeoxyribonuclease VII large subunit [Betaproteobacteria bacterium]
MTSDVLTVSQLLRSVRDTIERRFPLLWVRGEVSNLSRASSGHCYFTLKDGGSQVDCVMFRSRLAALDWPLADGDRVEARVLVTLYEPRGRFQLNVEALRRGGLGPLYERFLQLKARLEAEGLFDPAKKRPLPRFPRAIGVVTSLQAAALRDVLTTLARRNPAVPVIVYPVPVQGEGASERIAAMLARANDRAECDVLLLVRGGGSLEDLWPFNEERVARALRASRLPVVAGIGHETDFTIADFAADHRAPTPTGAAELASPLRAELLARIGECARCISRDARRQLGYAAQAVDAAAKRLVHPAARLKAARQDLVHLGARLAGAFRARVDRLCARRETLEAALRSLDPSAVLARGYSITRDGAGRIVRDAAGVETGGRIVTTLARGWLESEVRKKG